MKIDPSFTCEKGVGRGKTITQTKRPVIVINYVIDRKLTAICWRYILPVDSLANMENESGRVRKLIAFHQVPFHIIVGAPVYLVWKYCRV